MAFAVTGSIVTSLIGADSSRSAANKQADAANAATGLTKDQLDQTREDQAPYREAGYSALDQLKVLMGLGGNTSAAGYGSLAKPFMAADLAKDPGYQFQLQQGEQGIQRAATAAGRNYSGATLKALQRFGQGLASTSYNDAFNRNQATTNTLFNRLSGISGTGQTATNNVGWAGQMYANNASNNLIGAANVNAANTINRGNIFGNSINQGISAWQRGNSNIGGGSGGGIDPYGYLGGASTAGDYSDIRLKTNIKRVGKTERGFNVYTWDWKSGGSSIGVIAQEVQAVDPSAVTADADGFLMVDYSRV